MATTMGITIVGITIVGITIVGTTTVSVSIVGICTMGTTVSVHCPIGLFMQQSRRQCARRADGMTSRHRSTTDPFIDNLNEGAPFSLIGLLKFRVGEGKVIARPGSPSRVYGGAS